MTAGEVFIKLNKYYERGVAALAVCEDFSDFQTNKLFVCITGDGKPSALTAADIKSRVNKSLSILINRLLHETESGRIPHVEIDFAERSGEELSEVLSSLVKPVPVDESRTLFEMSFMLAPCRRRVTLSRYGKEKGGSINFDEELVICAASDVFLDSAMLCSYVGTNGAPGKSERQLSRLKYDFYKKTGGGAAFYPNSVAKSRDCFSFGFAARKSKTEFDVKKYTALWDAFAEKYFTDR